MVIQTIDLASMQIQISTTNNLIRITRSLDFVSVWYSKRTRQAKYVLSNFEARWHNHFCRGKAIIIKYYECVSVALVIQHAMRMHRVILSSVACLGLPYFPKYLINKTIFEKKSY